MGCRDCNSSLETCQNSLAAANERAGRAILALADIGGILDEYDDALRAASREARKEEVAKNSHYWEVVVAELASKAVTDAYARLEQWLLKEPEGNP